MLTDSPYIITIEHPSAEDCLLAAKSSLKARRTNSAGQQLRLHRESMNSAVSFVILLGSTAVERHVYHVSPYCTVKSGRPVLDVERLALYR